MINFKLKHIDEVQPAGATGNSHMNWFWLTDGYLWLKFGDQTIYEYSKKAMQYFGDKLTPYNDYYIVRFLEDFSGIFNTINTSVPKELYDLSTNLESFYKNAEKWWLIIDPDEEEINNEAFGRYEALISWVQERSFSSMHLTGGPLFSFFRHHDKIRIVWKTEHQLENGIDLWTAKDGYIETSYQNFISMVKNFGEKFFNKMEKQVQLAVQKNWKNIHIDKERLVEEHKERESNFWKQFALLKNEPKTETKWQQILDLKTQMVKEIKNNTPFKIENSNFI